MTGRFQHAHAGGVMESNDGGSNLGRGPGGGGGGQETSMVHALIGYNC